MKMRLRLKNIKGITLVALVVTVIVLMIITGITLTLVLGQDGLIGEAKKAKEVTDNSDKETAEGLNNLYNEIVVASDGVSTQPTVDSDKEKILSNTDNVQIEDNKGNTVTIPAKFKIASDSAADQDDGIVIEDNDGNEFVWIPVANISDYKRTDFGEGTSLSSCSEAMPADEQASVNTYHGYYIGRYEAGDSVSTASKTMRASGASVTNKVAIKKGQAPYNWLTRSQAIAVATEMKTAEAYKATTKLCSSYAWDTAINFMQKTISNYATSSNQGNYSNTTFNYTDIAGVNQTKTSGSSLLIPTGYTTPVCGICDMGGNDWEWTTETSTYPCVCRGGYWRK